MSSGSLYIPYKSIGYVCDSNPFCINRLGEEVFLTVSIGRCFQVFRFNRLTPCMVSKPIPANNESGGSNDGDAEGGDISVIEVIGHETFVAAKNKLYVYERANIVRTYEDHNCQILGLSVVGTHLISYDVENNIKVFDVKKRRKVTEVQALQKATINALLHPATYINKFIIGYSNGQLELWNFNKRKIVYSFLSPLQYLAKERKISNKTSSSTQKTAISCLEQSPACDVVAMGFSSGDILLLNLKLDCILFSFKQEGGAVTALSFRTDAVAERYPFMTSSSADGRLHIWNLGGGGDGDDSDDDNSSNKGRRLQSTLDDAHKAAVTKVSFLHGEPIMVSSSQDNSIKVWIFDSPDGSARLLKSREGHSGAPLRIRHYGGSTNVSMRDNADGLSCEMISAGSDCTLRLFNTAIESQNRELSQKPILKKQGLLRRNERLPECVGFDFTETKQRDWGNLVSIHKDHMNAYVWKFKHRVVTDMILKQPQWNTNDRRWLLDPSHHASAIGLSPCGNFCVVGSKGGLVYKYNLQSGLPRGSYPAGASALSTLKKGSLKQRERTPGNVLYEERQVVGDGKAVGANSLNPKPADPSDSAVNIDAATSDEGHTQEVMGVVIDMSNSVMVTCGLDGLVIFWNFLSHRILHKVQHQCPQVLMQGFRDANFVAVAGDDRVVRMFDIQSFKLARRFSGHSREITDMGFTPDGRRLLTASLDSTLRVWDLPTGRCVSWLSFSSPIQSMSISLSGEYLCVAQVDKEGIYMYLDKSLYETVHFWREPPAPVSVQDSLVRVDDGAGEGEVEGEGEGEGEDKNDEGEEIGDRMRVTVKPTQAQVQSTDGKDKSDRTNHSSSSSSSSDNSSSNKEPQKEVGSITMSTVPKVYWTSLFNLEVIKARNKPVAPPTAPPLAPFFLPSVVKVGAGVNESAINPSFPTPNEYKKLVKSIGSEDPIEGDSGTKVGGGTAKRRKIGDGDITVLSPDDGLLSSAWVDEDGDGTLSEEDGEDEITWTIDASPSPMSRILDTSAVEGAMVDEAVGEEEEESSRQQETDGSHRSKSRIINKKTKLPRCRLVAFLIADEEEYDEGSIAPPTRLLNYMRTLPPSAVDLEIRAICSNEGDDEGSHLLRSFVTWLSRNISTGDNFEVLQGYLHRTLAIYSELFLKMPPLAVEVGALLAAHAQASERFRHILQKNLSVLKMMAGVPTV